jgi:hypothetical protein
VIWSVREAKGRGHAVDESVLDEMTVLRLVRRR